MGLTVAHIAHAIKCGEFNEGLQKLCQSHPKDFAIQKTLAEIFIIQCDFTVFQALWLVLVHTDKTGKHIKNN